ncbi:L,D-transpeptidase family protein [Gephyromycinifex aptenodytis]|uniref:L,D-transpeptidase family protein n=1 Tax=Gephyromycinifex aptenodytis TaxID=2716227 RepID=UPI0021F88594|nr:L,D-transpeptidase family protein [Gephyromycinifex aptenodytis]
MLTLQQKLGKLGYWVGAPDGQYGHSTSQAVMAVQKVAGLGRDGVAGPATWRALERGVRPRARSTTGRVLEVDLQRQVMTFATNGSIRYVLNTSTGAPATPTPRGSYRIYRQQDGWRVAPLGKLYRPKYFHNGYAVHGVNDGGIPAYPASHGCTRVSMAAMDMLWGASGLRNGDRVLVY